MGAANTVDLLMTDVGENLAPGTCVLAVLSGEIRHADVVDGHHVVRALRN